MSERKNFGKLKEVIAPPNLIENQILSFMEFLQDDVVPEMREPIGLESVFRELFPIDSYDGRCTLEYLSYRFSKPKMDELECIKEGTTYSISLHVQLAYLFCYLFSFLLAHVPSQTF